MVERLYTRSEQRPEVVVFDRPETQCPSRWRLEGNPMLRADQPAGISCQRDHLFGR
jgi:hypothetical protein